MTDLAKGIWEFLGSVLAAAATLFVIVALAALVFAFGWNLGVVGLAAAAGASVSTIGFWTAFGGVIALSVVRGLVRTFTTATTTINNSAVQTAKAGRRS